MSFPGSLHGFGRRFWSTKTIEKLSVVAFLNWYAIYVRLISSALSSLLCVFTGAGPEPDT
jgi:hypothetical protein